MIIPRNLDGRILNILFKVLLNYSPSHIKWLVTIYSANLLGQKIFLSTKHD